MAKGLLLGVASSLGVLASSWAIFGKGAKAEEECKYALEILALQDASDSFASHVDRWASAAAELMDQLDEEFGEYKIGLSSFTDKPIPRSGYGKYGGWDTFQLDYCYARHVSFTNKAEEMVKGLNELKGMIGAGFDVPEAQAEAMIYAAYDTAIGWSATDVTHSESGRPIARIMLLITDARSHEEGNAASNLKIWNAKREYPNGYDHPSTGGFGASDFLDSRLLYVPDATAESQYNELSKLFAKLDGAKAGLMPALTDDESSRMQELLKRFGPEVYPTLKYPTHPGDNSTVTDCTQVEYPTLQQMIEALQKMHILPIFLTSTQTAYDFYEWYRVNVFEAVGVESVVAMFDSDTLFQTMIDSISRLVAKQCLLKTTESPTTTLTTQALTHPTRYPPGDIDFPSKPIGTENVVQSTESSPLSEASEMSQPSEAPEASQPSGIPEASEVTGESPDSTDLTTEEDEVIPPPIVAPIPETGGGSTGVIAGASAGAVAGLAALGGLLYKTVGFSAFGNSAQTTVGAEQMETPESPVEREAMEEVTIDMFH